MLVTGTSALPSTMGIWCRGQQAPKACRNKQCQVLGYLVIIPFPPQISRYFPQISRYFSQTFRLFRRRPNSSNLFAGILRASLAICRPMCASGVGDHILQQSLILHGIGTGPANHATFQSTGQRADILKLEDRTAPRMASPILVLCTVF